MRRLQGIVSMAIVLGSVLLALPVAVAAQGLNEALTRILNANCNEWEGRATPPASSLLTYAAVSRPQVLGVAPAVLRLSTASWVRVRSSAVRLIASPSAAMGKVAPRISPAPASACS